MASELLATPARATDSNGAIYSGAKWYFYDTGTTTPRNVYSDADLSTSLGSVVTADSGGKFAPIYFDAAYQYRGVLKDSTGAVTIYDIDPVNSSELTQLAASGGSALVGFIQAGTGAVARTAQDKMRDAVSVKDFGAAVDGSTDDTSAFQAALNTGKDIELAPGTMLIGLVTMASNDQRVVGTHACTVKRKNATAGNLFTITGASCGLIGFNVEGNSSNQTYVYNSREVLVSGAKVELRGLRINNAMSHGIGIIKGGLQPVLAANEIETVGDFGIFVDGSAGSGSDPAYGVCEGNTVINFGIQGGGGGATTSVGIGIRSEIGGWRVAENLVRNVTSRTNDQLGIECWTNSNNVIVDSNVIDLPTSGAGEFGLSVTGYGSVVSNNLITGTSSYGIEVIDRAVSVTGNVLRSPTGAGIAVNLNSGHTDPGDVMSITGNVVENTTSTNAAFAGIVVDGDAGTTPIAITISGNTIHGLSRGIHVDALVTGYTISGNTLYNTGSTMVGISADGSHGVVSGNTVGRANTAGTGNGGHIAIDGTGILVSGNRIAGTGYMDNSVLIGSGCVNCVVSGNFMTGASNAVFSNSTASSVVVRDNTATMGYSLNAANYATGNFNLTNGAIVGQKMPVSLGVFTVATLPSSSVTQGSEAYVTDANATTFNSIVAGGGANKVPVTYDGTNWRIG